LVSHHGGHGDIEKHVATEKHKRVETSKKITPSVSKFFDAGKDLSVIRAEVLFSEFLVEHNIPLSVTEHTGQLFRKMFSDSQIAKKYSAGPTKTRSIVGELARNDAIAITRAMQSAPYSLATDGSQDYSDHKLYPLVIKYFDENVGKLLSTLLATAENRQRSTGMS
jgi:hypothetical protein